MFTIFSSPPTQPLSIVRYQTVTPLGTMEMTVTEANTLASAGFVEEEDPRNGGAWLEQSAFRKLLQSLPCRFQGTPFQVAVWEELEGRLPGQTLTYAELSQALGRPNAHRAVGGAVARNPIAVRIPCHRVVPASGGSGEFRWSSWRKQALLDAENQGTSPFDFLFGAVTVKG